MFEPDGVHTFYNFLKYQLGYTENGHFAWGVNILTVFNLRIKDSSFSQKCHQITQLHIVVQIRNDVRTHTHIYVYIRTIKTKI